jgi:microsomal dipeptidase-like Zn-dependent dipeptidase
MNIKKLFLAGTVLLVLTACSGGNSQSESSADTAGTEGANAVSTPYDFANGCYALKSAANNNYLQSTGISYEASASEAGSATSFFMKPSGLGTYILFDRLSCYLSIDSGNNVIRTLALDDNTQWILDNKDGEDTFSLKSYEAKKWLKVSENGIGLILSDACGLTSQFKLEPAAGCKAFPEMDVSANVTTQKSVSQEGLAGFADTHLHLCANEGFGGRIVVGKNFSPLGITKALGDCSTIHGKNGSGDLIGNLTEGRTKHDTSGWPDFKFWPYNNAMTHQLVYYKWLERAYLGGLRLAVCHAVSNELLCRIYGPGQGYSCDDMAAVDKQLTEIKNLEKYIDAQCGGPGKGWFRIVYSPKEARQVISQGKLAVILGIEVATIFGAADEDKVDRKALLAQLDTYWDKGVRSIFPIHIFNNAFGGTNVWVPVIPNLGNRLIRGEYFEFEECPDPSFTYKEPAIRYMDDPFFIMLAPVIGTIIPYYPASDKSSDNKRGLTELGDFFIRELIKRKMIIETDHMSHKMAFKVLDICEEYNYPVVSSHGWIDAPEGSITEQYARRIFNLGGIVSLMLYQAGRGECTISSNSWAASYRNAVNVMKQSPYPVAIPCGSDANGMCKQPGPRFGSRACDGTTPEQPQSNPLTYPFKSPIGGTGEFNKLKAGNRTFDFNTEGLANYGLIPDFVADLKNLGLTDDELKPLYRSAEGYIEMWERVENR